VTREFIPDIVHLNTLSYGEVDFRAPVVQTIHSCVSSWWAEVKRAPLPAEWQQYRDHVEISLQGATILTAPSQTALLDVWKHYSVDPPDARSIYNGIDGTSFNSVEKESCILAAGRLWDEAKNLTTLAKIAPDLAWPVYMAGNRMSPGGALNTFATCRLLGELSREELRSWYARAAIYVLPARYEPFGLSILEAALSGCALVLGDIPSLREIWADAATFVTPDDTESLRRAIQQLITHEAQRKQMAQRARHRAGQFSIRRMTNDYLDVYRSAFALTKRSQACAS
jgi:glycosyltransferase involved in cell wall biosynthesis